SIDPGSGFRRCAWKRVRFSRSTGLSWAKTGFRISTVVGSIIRAHPTRMRLAHVAIPEHEQGSRNAQRPRAPGTRRFRSAGRRGARIRVRVRARGRRPVRSDLFDEADVADGDLFADFLGQESLD